MAGGAAHDPGMQGIAMVAAGAGWLIVLTLLTLACQAAAPDWIRGRAMSMLLLAFAAAMTVGSAGWGAFAEAAGPTTTTWVAAAAQAVAAFAAMAWRSPTGSDADGEGQDRTWPAPDVAEQVDPARGPVMVVIEYHPAPERREECIRTLGELGRHRRAEGSTRWSLHEHGRETGRLVETNELATWGDHLLQRERGSRASAELEDRVRACLVPDSEPSVAHWFGAIPREASANHAAILQRLLGRT